MKKSELRKIIKEEITKVLKENYDDLEAADEKGDVFGWYWPIADLAIALLKKDHPNVKLSAVGDGDEETYIGITASGFEGISPRAEKRFKVYFDEGHPKSNMFGYRVTNIEED